MFKELENFTKEMWWLGVIGSIIAIIFGLVTLLMPAITLVSLISLFATLLVVYGIAELVAGFSTIAKDSNGWWGVLAGAIFTASGIYLLAHPWVNAAMFISLLGWTLVVRGIYNLSIGISLAHVKAPWILSGVLNIAAAVLLLMYPVSGSLAFVWVLGVYALVDGVIALGNALAAKSTYKQLVGIVR